MIIHDFECESCGGISENFITDTRYIPDVGVCPVCKGKTRKVVSLSQTAPVDSEWISSVREVVDKDSDAPHCKEFLKHPSRQNYKKWMQGEGLRHLEPGEKHAPPKRDKQAIKDKLMKRQRERNAVSI